MTPAPQPKLATIYSTLRPSEPIRLYSGKLSLRHGADTIEGTGSINVLWRVMGPEVQFEIPSIPTGLTFPAGVECTLTVDSIQAEAPTFLTRVAPNDEGLPHVAGHPLRNMVSGLDKPATRVLFHLVNFWPFLFPRPDPAPVGYDVRGVEFEGEGWRVSIHGVNQLEKLEVDARNESGFAITHVGKIERIDGTAFSREMAHEVLHALHSFFSFARGLWSPPILFVGLDTTGEPIWQDWTVRRASPRRNVLTWFPMQGPQCLGDIFPRFMQLWQNATTREILEIAIHWYVEANLCSGAVEGAVILSQTGLERLAYYILVHERNVLKEADFERRGLSAADRLKKLFMEFGLPLTLDAPKFRLGTLPAIAASYKGNAETLVELRNCIVHPHQERSQELKSFPTHARREALTLCLWYYEVLLLKWFGYSGEYVNRQTVRFEGETEQIP